MIHPQFVKDQIATFDLYPPDGPADGDAKLSLFDCDGDPLSADWPAETPVSVDNYSQVLTADAKAGQRELNVGAGNAASLYQGWRGWLENEYGSGEEVIVDGANDATGLVKLANALTYSHDVGATPTPVLKSHLYRAQVPASAMATEQRDAYALWAWQHKGAWRYEKIPFSIVRTPWCVPITAFDVRKVAPALIRHAGHDTGRMAWAPLAEGASDHVEAGLYKALVRPDLILTASIFKRLVVLKMNADWMLQKDQLNQDELQLYRERKAAYRAYLDLVVEGELRGRTRTDFLALG